MATAVASLPATGRPSARSSARWSNQSSVDSAPPSRLGRPDAAAPARSTVVLPTPASPTTTTGVVGEQPRQPFELSVTSYRNGAMIARR
jgi:hypothetical protein